ncbi:hypothetical protein TCAL_06878 [Tigriopus californicus]|uniref:diphthine methyl ester synthase n=1 Tax=Tigriopus californicus TaxID=6832 RepID=A0A553PGP8_TIGCA|nr:diphthine methyl ester synthase-like [Tigriopus californicus]TRY76849.1 hypothetical protein TCAL_06878 [Tigriopus californicus]|eukprot:TCALIF_06878-PA protein Name:"Similar to DPH5 Diphthine synthase (Bos taurus)" AED:0.11 eAED:0.11 QI:0/1/0/1/1/1/2/0/273
MLYFIGLGLGDAQDITVKGLDIVKKCDKVFLEHYTSILTCGQEALEKFYGKPLLLADRDLVEQGAEQILNAAKEQDVAFLVVGDPFGATTHMDLLLRAQELEIPTQTVHNASIMNAIGACGLQLYQFGETVSIPFWTDTWKPESFYEKIISNSERGLHTLCLLDIKVKEQSEENLIKGRKIYDPPRFMTTQQAANQLIETVKRRKLESLPTPVDEKVQCIAVARIGSETQKMVTRCLDEMQFIDMGPPLHSLVIVGRLHPLEMDALKMHALPY